ncbi:MAG: hypothetical protein R2807_05760 [Chitinophagales bacterium]
MFHLNQSQHEFSPTCNYRNNYQKISKETLQNSLKIIHYVKPHKTLFFLGLIFLILSTITALLFPYLFPLLIDLAHQKKVHLLPFNGGHLINIYSRVELIKYITVLLIFKVSFPLVGCICLHKRMNAF